MKRNLSKKEALKLTMEMWKLMAESPKISRKSEVLNLMVDKNIIKASDASPESDCFLCQYTIMSLPPSSAGCDNCPLHHIWPRGCVDKPSVFLDYVEAISKYSSAAYSDDEKNKIHYPRIKECENKIYLAALEALNKLEEEKQNA